MDKKILDTILNIRRCPICDEKWFGMDTMLTILVESYSHKFYSYNDIKREAERYNGTSQWGSLSKLYFYPPITEGGVWHIQCPCCESMWQASSKLRKLTDTEIAWILHLTENQKKEVIENALVER